MRSHQRSLTSADGSRIAWDVAGTGQHVVLLCNGLITNTLFWRDLLPGLEARYRVITWDLKGHGDSGPGLTAGGSTIPAAADDALRVLDAAGGGDAIVCGYSLGCQVAVEVQRQAPDRVRGLGLLLGPAARVFDTAFGQAGPLLRHVMKLTPGAALSALLPALSRAGRLPASPYIGRKLGLVGAGLSDADLTGIMAHWARVHGPSARRLALSAATYDTREQLQRIAVPTLIVSGDRDVFAPAEAVGAKLAARVPQARHVRLPHGTHTSLLEHSQDLWLALETLLDDVDARASSSVI